MSSSIEFSALGSNSSDQLVISGYRDKPASVLSIRSIACIVYTLQPHHLKFFFTSRGISYLNSQHLLTIHQSSLKLDQLKIVLSPLKKSSWRLIKLWFSLSDYPLPLWVQSTRTKRKRCSVTCRRSVRKVKKPLMMILRQWSTRNIHSRRRESASLHACRSSFKL